MYHGVSIIECSNNDGLTSDCVCGTNVNNGLYHIVTLCIVDTKYWPDDVLIGGGLVTRGNTRANKILPHRTFKMDQRALKLCRAGDEAAPASIRDEIRKYNCKRLRHK